MKLLFKVVLVLLALFSSTFLFIKLSGILTIEDIKHYFEALKSQPSYFIGTLVLLLLFADLFIAVPTMSIIILAGYFLGFELAILYVFVGLFSASVTGYLLSYFYADKILRKISKDKKQINQMKDIFNEHGVLLLILSRAMPMLPEITSCLAGTSKMPFYKYLMAWSMGSIPYLLLISYAGSISELSNPKPALYTAITVTALLWITWFIFIKIKLLKIRKK